MGQEGLGIVPDGFMETKKKHKGGRPRTGRCWLSLTVTSHYLQCQHLAKPQSPVGSGGGHLLQQGVKFPHFPLATGGKIQKIKL